jgi:inactive STAND
MSLTAVHAAEMAGLLQEYDMCSKKITELQEARSIEDSPLRKFELGEQLKKERLRFEDLAAKTAILKLGDALMSLDFKGQIWNFRNTIRAESACAFLVRPPGDGEGEAQDSIRLLVKRLFTHMASPVSTSPIKIRLESTSRRSDAPALWRRLARTIGASAADPPEKIAERIADRLRTQNVVLVITDLDRVDLVACMRDFWVPLAQTVKPSARGSYRLVLLLVDYAGVTSLPEPRQPLMPVGLPHVLRFPDSELTAWLQGMLDDLPYEVLPAAGDSDEAISLLLQQLVPEGSDPGPDPVLWQICSIWRCEERDLDAWLEI